MNLIIIGVFLLIILYLYRSFESFVYFVCTLDIFFRIMNFLKNNLNISELISFFEKYIPESVPSLIRAYTNSTVTDVLMWVYVLIFIVFLYYVIKTFAKKKRR